MLLYMLALYCVSSLVIVTAMPSITSEEPFDNEVHTYNFPFISRREWQARTAKEKTPLRNPVPYVVIHHSYIPPACYNREECSNAMRQMQNFHMDDRGWWDIGYNFGVGSDGIAYEGRGWVNLGAHSLHFNSVSIGICLIGDWRLQLPPIEQLKVTRSLIAAGVEMGYIKPDYKLVGHRQVRETECPGDALFNEIQSWEHYSPFPSSCKDLIHVPELPDDVRKQLIEADMNMDEPLDPMDYLMMAALVFALLLTGLCIYLIYKLVQNQKIDNDLNMTVRLNSQ